MSILPSLPQQEFIHRRQQFIAAMRPNSIAILVTAPSQLRNANTAFHYRPDSNFYYLTGFAEPEAVAVLVKAETTAEYILFSRSKDPTKEQWTGFCAGQQGAVEDYAADQAYPIQQLDTQILTLLQNTEYVYYAFGRDPDFDYKFNGWINRLRSKYRSGISAPANIINIETILHEMRLIKSPAEINLLKQAATITAQAHLHVMQNCQAEMYEYQLRAQLLHEYCEHGAQFEAFPTIVASGANSCILHYEANNRQMHAGELVLVDSGCEYQYYAADITRTFPVNGKFTSEQKLIYQIVLLAQLKAIEQVKPGNNWQHVQQAALQTVTAGLCELGILQGKMPELIEQEAYKPFYMHNVGHWLGLDVHDPSAYKINNQWRILQPGICLTIEPGIYILPGMPNVDERWWGIGIRIEDNILVTKKGHEVLTAAVPKSIPDIENVM